MGYCTQIWTLVLDVEIGVILRMEGIRRKSNKTNKKMKRYVTGRN